MTSMGFKPLLAFRAYDRTMRHKLGLLELEDDCDEALVRDLLQVPSKHQHQTIIRSCHGVPSPTADPCH